MSEWRERPLGDLVTLQRGFDLPARERVPGAYRIMSAGESYDTHNVARVGGPGFVIGRSTNIGLPQWSHGDFWPLNTTLFAKDFHGNDPRWLFHVFETIDLSGYNSGSAQPTLNRNYIASIPIMVPPLATQRAIAEVLGALDDKIAANRRTIDTADTLRAAIWGKATRDAHHVLLSSLAAFINGGAFTKGASGNGRPVVRIVEMNQGVSDTTVRTDLEVKDDQVVRAGDFLMSWSGSLTTSRWFGEESILNQHIFKVIPAEGVPLWAVASAVETKMPYFQFVASNKATTMGHIQRHHLDEDVAWPTVTSALNLQGTALWDLALAAERENQVLASTRDELLPLLMSGRITVGAASSRVEEVV